MVPPDTDLVFDDLHVRGGCTPAEVSKEASASSARPDKRDVFDMIESFDFEKPTVEKPKPPVTRMPIFFDGSEEDLVTPHTTTDEF